MWPFNRNQSQGVEELPPEVKEFYQEDHKERASVAWVLAIISLLVTVSVALGLFFGGRLIYRNLTHKKTNTTASSTSNTGKTATNSDNSNETPAKQQPVTTSKPSTGTVDNQAATTTTPSTSTTTTPVVTPTPAAITPTTPAPSTQPPAAAPTTVASTKLTNTGPGDTVALFTSVSVMAAVIHSLYTRRKISNIYR